MASKNFSLIFSLLIISAVLCSTTTVVVGTPPGPRGGAPFPPIHNPLVGTSPQLNKVAGRRGLLSVPGASPNTNSPASPSNNLVQVPSPPSKTPVHGSPKGGPSNNLVQVPAPPSKTPVHGSPKGVPGASPNTNSPASPSNNLVQVPAPPSKSPVHGSPKGGIYVNN
nr:uncharacterized protein LOC109161108 [Ipomoea batatas]